MDKNISVAVIDAAGKTILDSTKSKLPYKEDIPNTKNIILQLAPDEYKKD